MNKKNRLDRIFDAVVSLGDDNEREKRLDELCDGDLQLRGEVQDLLRREQRMGSFLDNQPNDATPLEDDTHGDSDDDRLPEIPSFRLLTIIGQGGMGNVWAAQQKEPVRRRVAVKVIRDGYGSRQIISRFEAERQALAMMDHPHIAKVLGGGTTVRGTPYFVMELVDGVPLIQYCDEYRLNIERRLRLFLQVCRAVQHAHQKGIIHRDLKPSNVLVTKTDGEPSVKVIDFGLAKAIDQKQKLTDESLHTQFGAVVGTLQYMSPEQADSNAADVDTRTDIYSLGVMLFELLTGSTPLEKENIRDQGLLQVLEQIRSAEPVRPSSRIDSSVESIADIMHQRQISTSRLQQILRGELDWIVMKALDTDRERRYETASALGDDIVRYLNHEPVSARPPSPTYRFSKFVRKNRGLVAASLIIWVLLLAGIVGTSSGFFKASQKAVAERLAKQDALNQKKIADKKAKEARIAAENSRIAAKRSSDALQIFTDAFRVVSPDSWPNAEMTAVAVLHQARKSLDSSSLDEEGRIQLLNALSRCFVQLTDVDAAISTAEELVSLVTASRGPNHFMTVSSLDVLARAHLSAGKFENAIAIYEQILKSQQTAQTVDDEQISIFRHNLANAIRNTGRLKDAIDIFEEVYDGRRITLGPVHRNTLQTMFCLGQALREVGKLDRSIATLSECADLIEKHFGIDDPLMQNVRGEMGLARLQNGDFGEAVILLEKDVETTREIYGPDHRETHVAINNLAGALYQDGQIEKAIPLYEEILRRSQEQFGMHPITLTHMRNLGAAYHGVGRVSDAIALLQPCLEKSEQILTTDHPDTLLAMNHLASCWFADGNYGKAIELFQTAAVKFESTLGRFHGKTNDAWYNLHAALVKNNEVEKALEIRESRLQQALAELEPTDHETLGVMEDVAASYAKLGRFAEAARLYQQQLSILSEMHGPGHADTLTVMANLGVNYTKSQNFAKAIPILESVLQSSERDGSYSWIKPHLFQAYLFGGRKQEFQGMLVDELVKEQDDFSKTSQEMAGISAAAGLSHLMVGDSAAAEKLLRPAWAFRMRHAPDRWTTANTASLLGAALLNQEKHSEAVDFLVKGYEGLKKRADEIPEGMRDQLLSSALDRLIRLAEANDDQVLLDKYLAEKVKR